MASNPLEFHPEAEQEYLTTLGWYRERSINAASKFEAAFAQAIARIQEAPERWPKSFRSCRKYTLHQFPFSIIYRVSSSRLLVLAVAHGHRRPRYWKSRS